MLHDDLFSFSRLGKVMAANLRCNGRQLLTVFSIVGALVFLALYSMTSTTSGSLSIEQGLFGTILFVGGFYAASRSLSGVHDAREGITFYMLPASTEEKLVSRILLGTIGYAVAISLIMTILSLAVSGIVFAKSGFWRDPFNPLQPEVLKSLGHYAILQSIFLFGSARFKRHPFLKTIFFCVLTTIAFFIVLSTVNRSMTGTTGMFFISTAQGASNFFDGFGPAGKIVSMIFWLICAPFFWAATLVTLKRTAIRS